MHAFLKGVMRAAVLGTAVLGAACTSSGFGDMSPRQLIAGGPDKEAEQRTVEMFAPVAVCPEVQVRDGTQLLVVNEKAKPGEPAAVRFQASIRKFARECHTDPASGATTLKVGMFGRLLAGPSGATGAVKLPVRVVLVRNGDEVMFSQLYAVDAVIAAGMNSVEWTQIVDGIVVPADKSSGSFVIYVGFDESKPGAKRS